MTGEPLVVTYFPSAKFKSILFLYTGSVGSTNMNEHSSRSHAIFSITVERSDAGPDKEQHVRVGKLHMVDLAVSIERNKRNFLPITTCIE